jgi:ribonucleases P/MRP protein subunit RPP40
VWISDFLSERWQRVCVQDSESTWSPVTSGVPQGSILGPILFSIVIDDLKPSSDKVSYFKYADDVTALNFIRKEEDDCITSELLHVFQWAQDVRFSINWLKTYILDFCTSSKLSLRQVVSPEGTNIKVVESARVLGVQFSNDMKWSIHVHNIVKSAQRKLGLLTILSRSNCSKEWLWRVYSAFIRSTLTYAFPAWCGIPASLRKKLERIENRASRSIGCKPSIALKDFLHKLCCRLAKKIKITLHLTPCQLCSE